MPTRACVRVFLILSILLLVATPSFARSEAPARPMVLEPPAPDAAPAFGAREDTLFLFAASGPGSYGSPGTDARGFTFDHEGGPAEAGWFGVDLTEQEGEWWHLADTDLCAGTGTDMSEALPFDTGDTVNDYALWCGRSEVCGWADPDGYGNNWRQYAVLDLSAHPVSSELVIDFAYRSDFEGDDWDWFEVRVDSAGVWKTVYMDNTAEDRTYRELSITVPASDFGGGATRVGFYFESDTAWSDQDGLFVSDLGAVWIDNIVASVDGAQVFAADFEDGLEPAEINFETPAGAGSHAALRRGVFQDDLCINNSSFMWTFFDSTLATPEYRDGVIPYGPPYVNEVVQSPHLTVDQNGDPIDFNAESQFWIDYWVYTDNPLNPLVLHTGPVVAASRGEPGCYGLWAGDNTYYWSYDVGWIHDRKNMTLSLAEAAYGETVTGLALRFGVIDACAFWCNTNGDGTNHPAAPYYDNIRAYILRASDLEWSQNPSDHFQDNFPGPDGRVRVDAAVNLQPQGSSTLEVGDSTVVGLDMSRIGGISQSFNADAGEMRPELHLWWRVIGGPHYGMVEAAQADPDDMDGIWSPWTGAVELFGDTWGTMQADSAQIGGVPVAHKYAFDFNDDYFEPGDIIEFFYLGEAITGDTTTLPKWATSSDPDLRKGYLLRCLPSPGRTILLVEDADGSWPAWNEALRYSGCYNFEVYKVQAPAFGLNNGLGCRAQLEHLAGYEIIIWDSGDLPAYTINSPGGDQICEDTSLLDSWLDQSGHDVGLWVMGNGIASDLHQMGFPFLAQTLGAQRERPNLYYDDLTGILVPRVLATHPDLERYGQTPSFWVTAGCPSIDNLDLVSPIGALTEVSHEWEVDPGYGAVAGIINRDPDGDGSETNAMGFFSVAALNPFGYEIVQDDGFGVPHGLLYTRAMAQDIMSRLLNYERCWPIAADTPPAATGLTGIFPNPFNPVTTIRFGLAEPGQVDLRIYDLSGRRVRTLVDGRLEAGAHELEWQGRDDAGHALASGVYFLRFKAGETNDTDKLILLK